MPVETITLSDLCFAWEPMVSLLYILLLDSCFYLLAAPLYCSPTSWYARRSAGSSRARSINNVILN
jgi:hypothetical protein